MKERRVRQKREVFSYSERLGEPDASEEAEGDGDKAKTRDRSLSSSEDRGGGRSATSRERRASPRPWCASSSSPLPAAGGDLSVEEAYSFWLHPDVSAADHSEEGSDEEAELWAVVRTVKLNESFESWFVSRACFEGCTTTEVVSLCRGSYDDAVRCARSVRDQDERFDAAARFPDSPPYYSDYQCATPTQVDGQDDKAAAPDEVVVLSVRRYEESRRLPRQGV